MKVSSQQLSLLSEITSEPARSAEGECESQTPTETKSETSLGWRGYLARERLRLSTYYMQMPINWFNPVNNLILILFLIDDLRVSESKWLCHVRHPCLLGSLSDLFRQNEVITDPGWLHSPMTHCLRHLLKSLWWVECLVHDRAPGPTSTSAVRKLSFPKKSHKRVWQTCNQTRNRLRLRPSH